MNWSFDKLIIEKKALRDPLTIRIKERLPNIIIETVTDARTALEREPGKNRSLVLMHRRGRFVKDFTTPRGSPPCGEKYIVTMQGCPYSCTYCYLKSYLDHRSIVIFTNTNELEAEITRTLSGNPPERMTTGELGDSLALDPLTGTISNLLPLFSGTETLLDVRTKSSAVDHLVTDTDGDGTGRRSKGNTGGGGSSNGSIAIHEYRDNLVMTWTLGPGKTVTAEEPGTAPLGDRLAAMSTMGRAGIRIGIRFDPIIPAYADILEYERLVEAIRNTVSEGDVYRFELGIIRFPSNLLELIRRKNPRSAILRGEYVKDREGKTRLYRPKRIKLYREIYGLIRSRFPSVPVELCMEDRTVWEDAGLTER